MQECVGASGPCPQPPREGGKEGCLLVTPPTRAPRELLISEQCACVPLQG